MVSYVSFLRALAAALLRACAIMAATGCAFWSISSCVDDIYAAEYW